MHKKSNQFRTNKYKNPKTLPLIPPRTLSHPNRLPDACSHPSCRNEKRRTSLPNNGLTRHGLYCDGSKPQWEAFIVLNLLTPSILMNDLSSQCRTVVLASGSLSPIDSLCSELNLLPPNDHSFSQDNESSTPGSEKRNLYRLQIKPKPLEASHVINLSKQLFAVSIGHFLDGSSLKVNYKNIKQPSFLYKLGLAIASIIEGIPHGGVLGEILFSYIRLSIYRNSHVVFVHQN